jgi:hypothetical protein
MARQTTRAYHLAAARRSAAARDLDATRGYLQWAIDADPDHRVSPRTVTRLLAVAKGEATPRPYDCTLYGRDGSVEFHTRVHLQSKEEGFTRLTRAFVETTGRKVGLDWTYAITRVPRTRGTR